MQTSDAAQGGDGQEGRHVEHHVCACDAADVALVNVYTSEPDMEANQPSRTLVRRTIQFSDLGDTMASV